MRFAKKIAFKNTSRHLGSACAPYLDPSSRKKESAPPPQTTAHRSAAAVLKKVARLREPIGFAGTTHQHTGHGSWLTIKASDQASYCLKYVHCPDCLLHMCWTLLRYSQQSLFSEKIRQEERQEKLSVRAKAK